MKVYFSEDTPLSEYEAVNKGFRLDVFVETNGGVRRIQPYMIDRLQQDYEICIETDGYYLMEPNMILAKETSKVVIIDTIKYLNERRYFQELQAQEGVDLTKLILVYQDD